MEQHAIDMNCSPDDFTKSENIVVMSKQNERARLYLNLPFFCNLVTYGNNIIASADERIYDFVKRYIDTDSFYRCFEMPQIHHLTNEFKKYGFLPCYQAEYWLPDMDILRELPCQYAIRVLEQNELKELYQPEWSNALSPTRPHLDVLGCGAYDGDKLIGLSGCSADCDTMWQIGVDVLPEYRRRGVAAALTSRLALEIIKRNKVPFYCCAWSNLPSARNAIKSGFYPAWVEHTSIEKNKALEWSTNKHFAKTHDTEKEYWSALDKLISKSKIIIDRPKDSHHPKYSDFVYPLDYGYLDSTISMDGSGIDIWQGSSGNTVDAIICIVDLLKRDSEIKILIGCNEKEKNAILEFHNKNENMKGILIRRG